jgi:hypothetical protein
MALVFLLTHNQASTATFHIQYPTTNQSQLDAWPDRLVANSTALDSYWCVPANIKIISYLNLEGILSLNLSPRRLLHYTVLQLTSAQDWFHANRTHQTGQFHFVALNLRDAHEVEICHSFILSSTRRWSIHWAATTTFENRFDVLQRRQGSEF